MDGTVAVYFESAAVITVLVLLGQVLELRASEHDLRGDQGLAGPRAEDRATRPCART
jgi:cation transport ATPase